MSLAQRSCPRVRPIFGASLKVRSSGVIRSSIALDNRSHRTLNTDQQKTLLLEEQGSAGRKDHPRRVAVKINSRKSLRAKELDDGILTVDPPKSFRVIEYDRAILV